MNRRGLTLLEVILATAILLAATATLARVAYITTQHAQRAEDRAIAIEIAEFQLQQLLLGQLPVQTKSRSPVLEEVATLGGTDLTAHPWDEWQFALQVQATQVPDVYRVQVDLFRLSPDALASSQTAAGNAGVQNQGSVDAASSSTNTAVVLFQYSVVRLMHVAN